MADWLKNGCRGCFVGACPRDSTEWQNPSQTEHLPQQTRGRSPSELPNSQQDRSHVGCAVANSAADGGEKPRTGAGGMEEKQEWGEEEEEEKDEEKE